MKVFLDDSPGVMSRDFLRNGGEQFKLSLGVVSFLEKAPKEVVEKERQKREDCQSTLQKLQDNLSALS